MFEGLKNKDSDDLSAEEVQQALPAANVEVVINTLRGLCCSLCSKRLDPRRHELRRKAEHHYWRAWLACEADHNETRVFRVDWLR